ncbi:MAG: DoxX family protein [Rhizobiales bacterium]|nr:DoxX family protein [Hyphomicrobiales bacterium]
MNGILPVSWSGYTHAALRIMTGLLFLAHGTAKLLGWPAVDMFKDGVPLLSLFGIGGLLEIVGGLMIVVGFFTRTVAFVLSGMMAVAYFMFHAPSSVYPIINQGELAIIYSFVFLWLATAGSGPWSVDASRKAA